MIYWIVAIVIVVIGLLILASVKKKRAVEPAGVQTHKPCSYCREEIEVDAAVCKYCRGVVVRSS